MKEDNIIDIINNAIQANRNNDYNYEKELVTNFKKSIKENYDLFEKTNEIDLNEQNGFKLDTNIMDNILNKYDNIDPLIKSKEDISLNNNNLFNSKVYSKTGVLLVLFDGNSYTMLEMIILGLLTHNTMIFAYDKNMLGTNGLIISLVQAILEKENLNKEMFQHMTSINSDELFSHFKSINKTIIIGESEFINKYIKTCTTETIISGYKNYDIYLDSLNDIELINNIAKTNLNINFYIKNDLDYNIDNAIYVEDIDEAITLLNYNSSKYSSAIFTDNNENATKFLRNINSKYVLVNTSPTIEQSLDIKEEDLLIEKTIILPSIINNQQKNQSE